MKGLLLLYCLLLSTSELAFGQTDIYDSILVGQDWRTFNVHLPKGYDPKARYPLVMGFHGGQQTGRTEIGWKALPLQSKFTEKADAEGFIIVYPEGKEFSNGRSWNAGTCCPPSSNKAIDDIAFIDRMLDVLFQEYPIDTTRVYATGTSNGGMFCYRLACELSHRIAAIAPNAASHMMQPCNPVRKMPIINMHSKVDPVVKYMGGNGPDDIIFLRDIFFPSQDSTLEVWNQLNDCKKRDTVVDGQGMSHDFIRLSQCGCGAEIHHYATTDGGHSWPGGVPNNVSPVSEQIVATDLIWDFFQNYTLDCKATSTNELESGKGINSYPNPVVDVLYTDAMTRYQILSSIGELVLESSVATNRIDVAALPKGMYLLLTEKGAMRFIKQ